MLPSCFNSFVPVHVKHCAPRFLPFRSKFHLHHKPGLDKLGDMQSEKFNQWVAQVGLLRASVLISTDLRANGNPGVTYQAIQQWTTRGVPPTRALAVERVTGNARHEIRPDIYPREDAA